MLFFSAYWLFPLLCYSELFGLMHSRLLIFYFCYLRSFWCHVQEIIVISNDMMVFPLRLFEFFSGSFQGFLVVKNTIKYYSFKDPKDTLFLNFFLKLFGNSFVCPNWYFSLGNCSGKYLPLVVLKNALRIDLFHQR